VAGGNSSETTNDIQVAATTKDVIVTASNGMLTGNTRSGTMAGLYSSDYFPVNRDIFLDSSDINFSDTLLTDSVGHFEFSGLPMGEYNLLIRDTSEHLAAFLQEIEVGQVTYADTGKLELTGTIRGIAFPVRGEGKDTLFVKGSPFFGVLQETNEVEILDLPPGSYQVHQCCDFTQIIPGGTYLISVWDSIQVIPDSTVSPAPADSTVSPVDSQTTWEPVPDTTLPIDSTTITRIVVETNFILFPPNPE